MRRRLGSWSGWLRRRSEVSWDKFGAQQDGEGVGWVGGWQTDF